MAASLDRLKGVHGSTVALAALAHLMLLAQLPLEVRLLGAYAVFVLLPGRLFVAAALKSGEASVVERWLLGLGCGYTLALLLTLALYAMFRPLDVFQLLVGADLVNGLLLVALLARRGAAAGPSANGITHRLDLRRFISAGRGPAFACVLLLAVAAPLRLLNLGASEFQGDEAKVVLRAFALLQGRPDALIAQRKPPGEILLQALFSGGLGTVTELSGRLPFAVAGLAAVLACGVLGRALFGRRAGLVAALLLAANGYFVAFGRVMQYESLALLLDLLAVLCLVRFAGQARCDRGYAVIGGLLVTGSCLSALSAVFLAPVAVLALWPQLRDRKRWPTLLLWLWPVAPVALLVLVVYGPLARGSGTDEVLNLASVWLPHLGSRLGENRPYFNLRGFLLSANHYTSGPYLLILTGLGILGTRFAYTGSRFRRTRHTSARATSIRPTALALLWLAGPLTAHLFLVRDPQTHWREIFPGLILLSAGAAAALDARLPTGPARFGAWLAGGLVLVGCWQYDYVAFVQTWPEYQYLYPRYRHPLDWSSSSLNGSGGIYGAAHHHGWKTVGWLVAQGQLPNDYATNERPPQAAWYLKGAPICADQASMFVRVAKTNADRQSIVRGDGLSGFTLAGRVYVDGRPSLAILLRSAPDRPGNFQDDALGPSFDRDLAMPWSSVGTLYWPSIDLPPTCAESKNEGT